MKYKLLKDLPWAKEWTIYEWLNELEGNYTHSGGYFVHEEYAKKHPDFFEKIQQQAFDGMIWEWEGYEIDTWYLPWEMNRVLQADVNYYDFISFATKEQAEKFDKKMCALARLKRWQAENDGFVPNWFDVSENRYFIKFCPIRWIFYVETSWLLIASPLFPYMSSAKIAERMIKECKEDLLEYFY